MIDSDIVLEFDAPIIRNGEMDAAYIELPYDIETYYGCRRLLCEATFDKVPYRGQVVRMGTPCYIIGVTKAVRSQLGKSFGDMVHVTIRPRTKK